MKKRAIPFHVKFLSAICVLSLILAGCVYWIAYKIQTTNSSSPIYMSVIEKTIRDLTRGTMIGTQMEVSDTYRYGRPNAFGHYMIGRFAQAHHDWEQASEMMQLILKQNPENLSFLKRGMILAMGSGDGETAFKIAHDIYALEKDSALVLLFLIAESFYNSDYKAAKTYIKALPRGSVSDFILPLLSSWADAAEGILNIEGLNGNSIHMYHGILISDFLKQGDHIDDLLMNAQNAKDLSIFDLERIADLYAHLGRKDRALNFYTQIMALYPQPLIQEKITMLSSEEYQSGMETIKNPQEGIANAFYDMARALIDEYSDESARVFANIALYLDPNYTNAKRLLAHITAQNKRFSEAISYYKSIDTQDSGYLDAQRKAAELLEQTGKIDEAVAELKILAKDYNDIDSMIQMGDIYRRNEQFKQAIQYYNRAMDMLDDHAPKEYWHLLYVRGMAYERLGNWKKAEIDLLEALEYQPDHPYILNYLGYAWADQGIKLNKSLEMIYKAVSLRPSDGYIADSLGWVLYQQEKYDEAIVQLERAVELLPYDPVVNDHLGDAYWKAGRKMEARFQWERALNYSNTSQDEHNNDIERVVEKVLQKLQNGLIQTQPTPKMNDISQRR